jgi:hypothetical protein
MVWLVVWLAVNHCLPAPAFESPARGRLPALRATVWPFVVKINDSKSALGDE